MFAPQINYLPDPKDSTVLWPQNDPHFDAVQRYYNNVGQYKTIDKAAATLAAKSWNQWAIGAVEANNAGTFANYRSAPVAPAGHVVTWDGSIGVVSTDGPPVWVPPAGWNVNEWELSPVGQDTSLTKINDPARNLQTGGFAGIGTPSSVQPTLADLLAAIQHLIALGKTS